MAVLGDPPDNVPVPSCTPLSLNVTVPVAPDVTVAVKVTALPYAAEGDDEPTLDVVDALFTV